VGYWSQGIVADAHSEASGRHGSANQQPANCIARFMRESPDHVYFFVRMRLTSDFQVCGPYEESLSLGVLPRSPRPPALHGPRLRTPRQSRPR
jgi:hypothetical protein